MVRGKSAERATESVKARGDTNKGVGVERGDGRGDGNGGSD